MNKAKVSIVLVFVMLFFAFSGWAEQDPSVDGLSTESMIHSWLEESAEESTLESEDVLPEPQIELPLVEEQEVMTTEELGPIISQDKPPIEIIELPVVEADSSEELDGLIIPEAIDEVVDSGEELSVTDEDHTEEPSTIQGIDYSPQPATIAILIDDLGYSRRGMNESLALPKEVALAILPKTPFAEKTALTAQEQQRIIMLHAPMENLRQLELGPGGLYADMSEEELKATLSDSLDSLPGVIGVNNHMGSLLTAEEQSMKWVMEVLQDRSLFFIDSLTNAESVAEQTAHDFGLDTVSRDVFLDNIRTEKAIDRQFLRLIKLAKRHGSALAIGHPYPETTAYLKKRLSTLEEDGVQLVPLTDVLLNQEEAQ